MRRFLVLPFVITVVLAGCGGGETAVSAPVPVTAASPVSVSPPTASALPSVAVESSPTATTVAEAGTGVEVTATKTRFGEILFDGSGQAIYLFDKEITARPDCYGACAAAWPPVLTDGTPQATGAVKASLLGTTERSDGAIQVTAGTRSTTTPTRPSTRWNATTCADSVGCGSPSPRLDDPFPRPERGRAASLT